jgi:hypothetical protein
MGMLLGLAPATRALAQPVDAPPGPFAIDARVALPAYAPTDAQAVAIGLEKAQLPKRGIGVDVGVTVYPLRRGGFALGLGVNYLSTSGKQTATTAALATDPNALENAPEIKTTFKAFTPQLSLNFGTRRGWSYLSGGVGTSRRDIEQTAGTPTVPDADPTPRIRTINYGGGARWFASAHLAFGFDLRWYRLPLQEATSTTRAFPKQSLFIASAGISIR